MKRISKRRAIYQMSAANPPAARVTPGETFVVEVEDCYSARLKTKKDVFTKEMWPTVNPATGPVFVEGARPGDILKVEILQIKTRKWAVMCVEHGAGALADFVEGIETVIFPIRGGKLVVSNRFMIPVDTMIGVIGTAPKGAPILTGTPGEHGANMDTKEIAAGATVYLPVNVEGALLALGDLHAVMGDGEVCICGAETAGEVKLRVSIEDRRLPTPCVENDTHIIFIGSALHLDDCEKIVLAKAHRYLTECLGMKPNDAARLMSLVGQLRVSQVVDPLKTMKFMLPKEYLAKA